MSIQNVEVPEKEMIEANPEKNSQKLPLSNKNVQSPMQVSADRPEKNHVMDVKEEEEDYVDGMAIPRGVKVEVEGGDSQVPPGFEEKEGDVAPTA